MAVEWEDALISVGKALFSAGGQSAAVVGGLADAEVFRIVKIKIMKLLWDLSLLYVNVLLGFRHWYP